MCPTTTYETNPRKEKKEKEEEEEEEEREKEEDRRDRNVPLMRAWMRTAARRMARKRVRVRMAFMNPCIAIAALF